MRTALLAIFFSFSFFSVFSQVKLDSGLVAYYPFNGNANDSTGHGNNPVFNNATLTSDMYGNVGKAYHFDGSSTYMRISNGPWLNMGTKMTICANVKPMGFYTGPCRGNAVIQKGDNDNTLGNYILRFNDSLNPCGNPSTADEHFYGRAVYDTGRVQLNKWYNIIWTYDGTAARIYINGKLVNTTVYSLPAFTNSYDLFFGRTNNPEYPYWFNGDLDEVRFYNRALNSQEITALNTPQGMPTITSFSPASAGKNNTVVINGTNFTGATAVSFGGISATSFTVNSTTKITAKVGAGASGSVSVTTPGGTATLGGFTFCLTPSVKITANKSSQICAGTKVVFTATPTNGGTSPVYQWMKNGAVVGTNSATYADSLLATGDSIYCTLTSNASPCVTTSTVSSTKLTFTVTPVVTPSVSIAATPGGPFCIGANVLFTATPVNGGTTPVYQWVKNGVNTGTNAPTYTDSLAKDSDSIMLKMTTNAACATTTSATSNVVKVTVDVPHPVISITANKDTAICANTAVTFTAAVDPVYLWKKNGVVVGNSSNTYKDSLLKTGDNVQCFLVSSATGCNSNSGNILNSNKLKFAVKSAPAKPSSITGPANVKVGQTGVYFSVTAVAGVTYAWTLPAGALIDSGQGGNKIKVTWGSVGGTVSVIAINNCGSSAATAKTVGVVPALTSLAASNNEDNSVAVKNGIILYPNPAGAVATVQFSSKVAAKYTITVYDAQDKVLEVKSGMSVKGTNTIKLNTAKYAKGTYFITVIDKENGRRVKPLVIGE